jgi:hypothetical protein
VHQARLDERQRIFYNYMIIIRWMNWIGRKATPVVSHLGVWTVASLRNLGKIRAACWKASFRALTKKKLETVSTPRAMYRESIFSQLVMLEVRRSSAPNTPIGELDVQKLPFLSAPLRSLQIKKSRIRSATRSVVVSARHPHYRSFHRPSSPPQPHPHRCGVLPPRPHCRAVLTV